MKLTLFLKNLGCKFGNLSCAVNYKGIEMEFPPVGMGLKPRSKFCLEALGEIMKGGHETTFRYCIFFCSETGEK